SIFVNPLQFAPGEDLSRYPRREQEDAALLEREGVDVLYLPTEASLYPPDFSTIVEVAGVTEGGEGAVRPGHFRGVATVVLKLAPKRGRRAPRRAALPAEKHHQQGAGAGGMPRAQTLPIRLVVGEVVRETDGLAMSSRNAYLSAEDRRRAPDLARTLMAARAR